MRNLLTCTILFLLSGICSFSFGQNKTGGTITGSVVDEKKIAVEDALIAIYHSPDSAFIKAVNLTAGKFIFQALKAGKYFLVINRIGYKKTYAGPFDLADGSTVDVGLITLPLSAKSLTEVVVSDHKHYIDVKHDRTIINVDRNITTAGASVTDILRTAPGVKVNAQGDISLRGGQTAAVFVNGKLLQLSGTDLAAYLQSLSSANIEQIELMSNPPARYDAIGTGGVINIVLKKGKNEGFNGTLNTYAGYGNFGKGSSTLTTNYRSKNLNIFGTIGYLYNKTDHATTTDRAIHGSQLYGFNTRYYWIQKIPRLDYRVGADYTIDSLHTIGFSVYGNNTDNDYKKNTTTYMSLNRQADSVFSTKSNHQRDVDNINFNINYTGNIGHTKQVISADADFSRYSRHMDENIYSYAQAIPRIGVLRVAQQLKNDTLNNVAPTIYTNPSVNVDYLNPLSKALTFEAGAKYSYTKMDNDQYFNVLNNGVYEPYPAFTSSFLYRERLSAGYADFHGNSGPLGYTASLRVEHRDYDANTPSMKHQVERKFTSYYPAGQLNYTFKNKSQLALDYSRRIDPPPYESLNPIIYFQDSYNYRVGNAYLKPAYNNDLALTYTGKSDWWVTLDAYIIQDFWHFSYFKQDAKTMVLNISRINFKNEKAVGLKYNIPARLTKWWNLNLYGEAYYMAYTDTANYTKRAKDISFNLSQTFTAIGGWSAVIQGYYDSPTYLGITSFRPLYYVNASVSKQLFQKAATLTFSYQDIFNTNMDRSNTQYHNLDMQLYDKGESRFTRLTFTYRFGKKTVKAARKHNAGNDEEQKRMSAPGT